MERNRRGRRDERFGRTARRNTGNRYSRSQVLKGAGMVAAGLGAAAVGFGGVAHAVGTTWNVPADGDIKPNPQPKVKSFF